MAFPIPITIQGSFIADTARDINTNFSELFDALQANQNSTVNVADYGAVGDGVSHPLSDYFVSLAAAQVVYSFATSLTNQIDWCAAQLAVNTVGALPYGGQVNFNNGRYFFDQPLKIQSKTKVQLVGTGMGTQLCTPPGGATLEEMVLFKNSTQCGMFGFNIIIGDAGVVTYGVVVTATSSTHGVIVFNVYVDGTNANCTLTYGFAVGPDTTSDVAQTAFYHCAASAPDNDGWLLGNGNSGNVLDTRLYDIQILHCGRYGVNFNGSNGSVFGFSADSNGVSDFHRGNPCSSPIRISSGRSEESARFWDTASGSSFVQPIIIDNVSVAQFTDAGGFVLVHNTTSPLLMMSCTFRGGPVDVHMGLGFTSSNPTVVTAINVWTTGTPFASVTNKTILRCINCGTLTGSGAPTAGTNIDSFPAFTVPVDGIDKVGFYGVTPITRAVLATGTGATVDNVITALQNLGLVSQS